MEKALTYVGKRDREAPLTTEDHFYTKLTSETVVHNIINGMSRDIKEEYEPTEAMSLYVNARYIRHDNWCEFLTSVSTIDGFAVQDRKVIDFHKSLPIEISSIQMESKMQNLSPDILTMDNKKTLIYLGDVTVTNTPGSARARKHEKYACIEAFYKKVGMTVMKVDFILKESLSNFASSYAQLIRVGFCNNDPDKVAVYQLYSIACNRLMELYKDNCNNKRLFDQLLGQHDKYTDMPTLITPPPMELLRTSTSPYVPLRTEHELMEMVRDEVSKVDIDSYFCTTVDRAIHEIDNLYDANSKRNHMQPKSILKVIDNSCENEQYTGLGLVKDYINDIMESESNNVSEYILHLMPTNVQLELMIAMNKKNISEFKESRECKELSVYGPYQYRILSQYSNHIIYNFVHQLTKGKKNKNDKEDPKVIDLSQTVNYSHFVDLSMEYYGLTSCKPSFLDDSWDSRTKFEHDNTKDDQEVYRFVKSTNGAQLCNSLAQLYNRISHLSTSLSTKDNIFVPPNGSFICIIPKEHAPITSKSVDLPFIFITRTRVDRVLTHIEYEHTFTSDKYIYYVSKLSRLNVDKISNWANAGYKLIATATYIINRCSILNNVKHKVVGLLTYMMLDSHQKTSEFLDLLKYVSFMPFSDISRLPELIKDKFDLLMKTKLDAWMLHNMRRFIMELSKVDKLNAVKPKIRLFNSAVVADSLGIKLTLPSFVDTTLRHTMPDNFIEEINLIYTIRPKHLYGSQFMDKSITDTCKWNEEYSEECEKYKGWATIGHDESDYPFDAKFCYSADAIVYAEAYLQSEYSINKNKVMSKLENSVFTDYMHANCTLRGCTKKIANRETKLDIHTTSLDACLDEYKNLDYDDEKCKVSSFAYNALKSKERQQYSMSEKEQRGGGRPISTPTLNTKAMLMMIEKPEAAKGSFMKNNIIVPGRNKLSCQCETYKTAISDGSRKKYKCVYQLTEDQTKYSENDNPRKFEYYIRNNESVSDDVKAIQLQCLRGLYDRDHLVKRIPIGVESNNDLHKYKITEEHSLGVRAIIGWPQGMLNFISTNVHCAADLWITKLYNMAYFNDQIYTRGLVHSDDSWVVVCCNDIISFKRFALFRCLAKKYFCLKLNQKKLWGSKYLGELVSNYNLNGNVHLSVSKTLANSFANLTFQNWSMDVSNQVSAIQQCYRAGANISTLILMSTILRQQMISTYQVKGFQLENIGNLPIDIGGYPSCSAFELATCGVTSHYKEILNNLKANPKSNVSKLIQICVDASMNKHNLSKEGTELGIHGAKASEYHEALMESKWDNDDYENLVIPSRGDVFKAIRHIMPKSNKLAKTLKAIRALPFESNGLEMIVTRAKSIDEALGHLKAKTASMLYQLASEKYTQSIRRLAISQTIQSSGKVIKFCNYKPMTFNELYEFCMSLEIKPMLKVELIAGAFSDDNELIECAHSIVHCSESSLTATDKRKVINVMPEIEDKFTTIGRLSEVLLTVIDDLLKTNYLLKYTIPTVSIETLMEDSERIKTRFHHYFRYHDPIYACSLIMQQYNSAIKARLWTQPKLRSDNLMAFLEDLYGRTISDKCTYNIYTNTTSMCKVSTDKDIVQTIYCTMILNVMYPGKFTMVSINGIELLDALRAIDYTKLSDNDMLKFATCVKAMFNNNDYLHRYLDMNHYVQSYLIPQVRTPRGYEGHFSVMCRLGNVVLKMSGVPGNMRLMVNTPNVPYILKIMRLFTARNFSAYKYSHDGSWGNSALWGSEFEFSANYLSYFTSYSTVITTDRTHICMPLDINSNLQYGHDTLDAYPTDYDFDPYLRIIYAITPKEKYRIGNIYQNFGLPLRKTVKLVPNYLNNMEVELLYTSGIIEASVLNSLQNIDRNQVEMIFNRSPGVVNFEPVGMAYLHLMCNYIRLSYHESYARETDTTEITTYDVGQGIQIGDLIEIAKTTDVEDLDAIVVDYVTVDSRRQGKIYINPDLRHLLCSVYTGQISRKMRDGFLYHVCQSPSLYSWGKEIKQSRRPDGDDIDAMYDYMQTDAEMKCTMELMSFIMVTKLDCKETWYSIRLSNLLKYHEELDHSYYIQNLAHEFVRLVSENLYGDEIKKKKTLFDIDDTDESSDSTE